MNNEEDQEEQLCAVCLQKLHHPAQLPCGHVFCFLCVKGVAFQNRKCAMCRSDIPLDYFNHPVLLEQLSQPLDETQLENQWYYEGRNGWWKYDERSNIELEDKFNNREDECILLLAGALYCVDFRTMTQVRCSDQTRRRRVKRDAPTFPSKGIAGIKISNTHIETTKSENDEILNSNGSTGEVIEIGDDDVQIVEPVIETVNIESDGEDDISIVDETTRNIQNTVDDDGNDVSEVISSLSLT